MCAARLTSASLLKASFSLLFMAMLMLPGIGSIWSLDLLPELAENRSLATSPAIANLKLHTTKDVADAVKSVENYLMDHFGFRRILIASSKLIRFYALDTSPSKSVLIGRDGWYYYAAEHNIEAYRGEQPFNRAALKKWAHFFKQVDALAQTHNISFFFLIAPDTPSIYAEYLPRLLGKRNSRNRLDQLLDYMGGKQLTAVKLVDVRSSLTGKKDSLRLYMKTDSHWNELGAFYATQTLVETIKQGSPVAHELAPLTLDDYSIVAGKQPGGDLATMMGLRNYISEENIHLEPLRGTFSYQGTPATKTSPETVVTESDAGNSLRVTMFHDTFAGAMLPFMSRAFLRVHYVFQRAISVPEIVDDGSQIVVAEIVERSLYSPPPKIAK